MIRKPSVSLEFKRLTIPEKTVFGQNVHDQILANVPIFADPDVPVATLLTDNNSLKTASVEAQSGDHQKVAAMYSAEKTWDTTFGSEADYVDRISNGAEDIILLSGYKVTKSETSPALIPAAPVVLDLSANALPGSIHIELEFQQSVKNYLYICSSDSTPVMFKNNELPIAQNTKVVGIISDNHRKADFYGLPSRTDIHLSVVAQNSAGISTPSEPIAIKTL
jgi:hypothetical protein